MQDWIPWAKRPSFEMKTQGEYAKKHPIGCIVHFTAGNSLDDDGFNSFQWGKNMGYAYLFIDRKGVLWQAHPLSRWGSHAGSSAWKGIEGSVSDDLVGIEIASAGKLISYGDAYFPWFAFKDGKLVYPHLAIPRNEIRIDDKGAWHAYTHKQEETLLALIDWLYKNAPGVFKPQFILGHDEVAPARKNDPGGALSLPMPELRQKVMRWLAGEYDPPKPTEADWLELFRLDQDGRVQDGVVARLGAEVVETWTGTDTAGLVAFLQKHMSTAKTTLVAPESKPFPGLS